MAKRKPLYEIFEKIAKTTNIPVRVKILRHNQSKELIEFLSYATNPNISFLLPEGDPPYTPSREANTEMQAYTYIRELPCFVAHCGTPVKKLTKHQREHKFIQMLQNMHPKDAELFIAMKNKKIKFVTPEVVKEAFPKEIKF